ncbi:hypothetical protein M758_10G054800 [Ceratodon purpureus]|nr:hypothetical protein M758_10G054800 [Ceratodon purpureus]
MVVRDDGVEAKEAAVREPDSVASGDVRPDSRQQVNSEDTLKGLSEVGPVDERVLSSLRVKESGEGDGSQGTSEAEKKSKVAISHEVKDEPSSDTDMEKEGEDAAQERSESAPDAPRWTATGVETYAIQCNVCFKWRVVPSKERYEAIGEQILQKPFECVHAQEWRHNASCEEPADIEENEPTVLWAIDKHNLPRSPKGFYRKVVLRAENAKKFADIYYKAPCGKTLRSMVQVQKYLDEHPHLGVDISQFSFTSPKGKTDETQSRGVSTKRPLKNEAHPSKKLKGSPDPKTPGHGQPPRPKTPSIGKGSIPKYSASKLNDVRRDTPVKGKLHGSKGAPHPMAVKREKFGADGVAK